MSKIIYVDEEPRALTMYGRILGRLFKDKLEVVSILPEMKLEGMLSVILSTDELASVIVDQRLNSKGTAGYLGSELVAAIRESNKKIPLYILSNFSEDLPSTLSDVEYVLSKDDLNDASVAASICGRILRHINVYEDMQAERELRFSELLEKSLVSELDGKEAEEFSELSRVRLLEMTVSEALFSDEVASKMKEAEALIAELKKEIEK